ncbi:Uncharacterised protein [uncultured Clostridium sp.]|jgi:hypothetical protein|nr:Uncharacterised protein [uncultured Clostridium sp.]
MGRKKKLLSFFCGEKYDKIKIESSSEMGEMK